MKSTKFTARMSLRAKFKDANTVELVIINNKNEIQIEMIPIHFEQLEETVNDSNSTQE